MKKFILTALLLIVPLLFKPILAADKTESATPTELKELVEKIRGKLSEGKTKEADLADELKEFDALIAKHKDEKTDDTAQLVFMKAMLYAQVFEDSDKAIAMVEQIKKDYPETATGTNADKVIAQMKSQAEGEKIQRSLAEGTKFPDFEEKDLAGKPLSLAGYKGKVVLVDFWATWCGPCVAELPNVLKTYEKHHPEGFDIIGISLDNDKEKLTKFIDQKKMPWAQYFDGKGWESKLGVKYGVKSIPMTYLIDGEGKIIGKKLRGEALEKAVAAALAKK